ncbi:type I-U CRISPR-associated protein Csx17 [bacterium]|nr:type I-U CRISPR-associated protein Csx17 [bacterium]
MSTIELTGCSPEPLMNYLKALGVFRLLAEDRDHGDPQARLFWSGGVAVLQTKFDREQLVQFFLSDYQPTPIVAPWNGGSGFYGGGAEPLEAIAASTAPRLRAYRETIAALRPLIPNKKPTEDAEKLRLLVACRNELSDEVGAWLDSCFVLSEKGRKFFPLLGTGGNDLRLEFTNNLFQRLADVINFHVNESSPSLSNDFLNACLFADTIVSQVKSAVGQFNPGGVGGPNGTQGKFEADFRVNPWDYVLMLEGTLLFAGAVARRLGSSESVKAAFPFTVDSIAVGYGSAIGLEESTDGSRAELWLPLWPKPASYKEVKYLFSEGRAQLSRRQAKNAVEFVLSASLLGVDRGICSFVRYGFLNRSGKSFLATPLGRVTVTPRPHAQLLQDPQLTHWLDRWRTACRDKEKTPLRYQMALRNIDLAMFEFANRSETGNDAPFLLNVLRMLGRAERTLAKGLRFAQDKYLNPLSGLNADWLNQANDGSVEFRLAMSLASIQGTRGAEVGPIRTYLEEVAGDSYPKWEPGSCSAVWSNQSLADNLAAVFRRRQMEAFRAGCPGVPLPSSRCASLSDITRFLRSQVDDAKLEDLLWGLLGVTFPSYPDLNESSQSPAPFEFGCLRLLVQTRQISAVDGAWRSSQAIEGNVHPHAEVFHPLASTQPASVADSVDRAARRLKSGGLLVMGYRNRLQSGQSLRVQSLISPQRLLAAMLFPLSEIDISRIANTVLYPPETEE